MKIKTGIGVTTLCAMLAAVPVFGYANASELSVSGSNPLVETPSEQKEELDTLSITEKEVSDALGEMATEVSDPAGAEESEDLPVSQEADSDETAVIQPAIGQVSSMTMASDDGEEVVVQLDLADAVVIPSNGVNGSFVSNYEETIPVEWSDEFSRELYNANVVCYEDENLSKLAEEYSNKGYYISDLKKEGELLGAGIGYGEYYFNSGFCVVDDITGNNSFITYVAKISQTDFDKFIEELGDYWTKKSATEYTCNDRLNDGTITFDPSTGILIYTNNIPEDGLG